MNNQDAGIIAGWKAFWSSFISLFIMADNVAATGVVISARGKAKAQAWSDQDQARDNAKLAALKLALAAPTTE